MTECSEKLDIKVTDNPPIESDDKADSTIKIELGFIDQKLEVHKKEPKSSFNKKIPHHEINIEQTFEDLLRHLRNTEAGSELYTNKENNTSHEIKKINIKVESNTTNENKNSQQILEACEINKVYVKNENEIDNGEKQVKETSIMTKQLRNTKIKETPRKHRTNEELGKRYICSICQIYFPYKTKLYVHERKTHNKFRWACDNCGKGFSTKISLLHHTSPPSGGQKLNCNK